MKKRPLGNSGLEVAPLMVGGNVLGWTAMSFRLLNAFVDGGFDFSEAYAELVPIASATNPEQLEELMGGARLALPAVVLARLNDASPRAGA